MTWIVSHELKKNAVHQIVLNSTEGSNHGHFYIKKLKDQLGDLARIEARSVAVSFSHPQGKHAKNVDNKITF